MAMRLNYELLIACALIVVSLLAYLFYWNRILSLVFNALLRVWGWNAGASSMWVEFRSIHFSMLRGRILLKDLRVHTSDLTAKVVACSIEWRYWIRRPLQEEDLTHQRASAHVSGDDEEEVHYSTEPLPCRVHVKLRGLELYMHNRVSSFDHIVSEMEQRAAAHAPQAQSPDLDRGGFSIHRMFSMTSGPVDTVPIYPPSSVAPMSLRKMAWFQRLWLRVFAQLPTMDPKDLLPFGLEIAKAVVICGNAATRNILVFDFQRADGVIGIVPSRSKHDHYKQVIDLKLRNVAAHFVENEDYQSSMLETGKRINDELQKSKVSKLRRLAQMSYATFAKLWRRINLAPTLFEPRARHPRAGPIQTATQRVIRAFKRHEEEVSEIDYTTFEYAVERKWLEAPTLELSYYVDSVGLVPIPAEGIVPGLSSGTEGDLAPEWGVDIIIHGGSLKYGPWADRQRADIQKVFFPSTFSDTRLSPEPRPGDKRIWPALKVFIELRGGTSIVVPFREPSKNWQWDKKAKVSRAAKRDAAHMTLKAADGSTISYHMPMVPGADGYDPVLEVHLDSVSLSSSLNDMRFVEAESCRVRAAMPSPLAWKAPRQWDFAITLRAPSIHLLRDHINMFTDLAKDWSSGPAAAFNVWIPMSYRIHLTLWRYRLNLYANDLNIVDTPLLKDSNVLFTLRGNTLRSAVDIPSDVFNPSSTTIPFSVEVPSLDIDLGLPRWNTNWADGDRLRGHLGRITSLKLDGSYMYHAEVTPSNLEQLDLHIKLDDFAYKAFGWTIRSGIVLRDNYFGGFTHFQTLSEYLAKLKRKSPVGDSVDLQYRPGSSNPMQLLLKLECKQAIIVLPVGLPGYEAATYSDGQDPSLGSCAIIDVSQFSVSLRTHDEFMEMSLNTDVIGGHIEPQMCDRQLFASSRSRSRHDLIVMDGLNIVANRLFGPPPHALAYVCIWELDLGRIKSSLSCTEVQTFASAIEAFQHTFADLVNAPAAGYAPPVPPDATFVSLNMQSLHAVWNAGRAVAHLSLTQGLKVQTNNVAGRNYSSMTSIAAPVVDLKVLHRSPSNEHLWSQVAHARLNLGLDMYSAPSGWEETAHKQREFLAEQDAATGRFLGNFTQANGKSHKRAVVRDGRYLPGLLLPLSHHSGWRQQPRGIQVGRIPSAQTDGSDSDPAHEVDWDARVASRRPQYPVQRAFASDDGESMSGGDESDDTDLVDAAESDADPISGSRRQSISLTAEYTSDALEMPSLWPGSPFMVHKSVRYDRADRPPHERDFSGTSVGTIPHQFRPPTTAAGRSVNHLSLDRVDLVVSPAVASSLDVFLTDLTAWRPSPELRLDSILARHVKSASAQRKDSVMSFFSLDLSLLTARCLQTIVPAPREAHGRVSSAVELTIHDFHGHTRTNGSTSDGLSMSTSFGEIALSLSSVDVTATERHRMDLRLQDVLHVSLQDGHLGVIGSGLNLGLGSGLIRSTHAMPEVLLATGLYLGDAFKGVPETLARHRDPASGRHRTSLLRSITYTCHKQLVDQLSTTQPSYLVQTGLPKQLRDDAAYKILLYMRASMSQLSTQERSDILDATSEDLHTLDAQAIQLLLERQVMVFANDAQHAQGFAQQLWAEMFPEHPTASSDAGNKRRPMSLQFQMASLAVDIEDPDARTPSSLSIGPVSFNIVLQDRTVTIPPPTHVAKVPPVPPGPGEYTVHFVTVAAALGSIRLRVLPHLLDFVRGLAREGKRSLTGSSHGDRKVHSAPSASTPLVVEVSVSLGHLGLQAAAETLTLETSLNGAVFVGSMSRLLPWEAQPVPMSSNWSFLADEVAFRALNTVEQDTRADRGVLASFVVSSVKANVVYKQHESVSASVLRAAMGINSVHLSVPRSALRLYRFVEEWQEKYLPRIEAATVELLSEIRNPQTSQPDSPRPRTMPLVQAQVYVGSLLVALHVMRGSWFSWHVDRVSLFGRSPPLSSRGPPVVHFGLKLASQILGIAPTPDLSTASSTRTRVKVDIPTILVMGRYDQQGVFTLASMDMFRVTIKPSHVDTVLTVQQKFGQDFNDLLALIQHRRTQVAQKVIDDNSPPVTTPAKGIKYSAFIKMKGLRVGLRGPRSTLYLECEDIGGGFHNELGLTWQMNLTDAALSLAPHGESRDIHHSLNRAHRSAFVVVDMNANGEQRPRDRGENSLKVNVTKVHAVLRPSSIAEIGDFINDLQTDLHARQNKRATELAEFKAKTSSIMRAFDVSVSELRPPQGETLLNKYNFAFQVKNIGVAFPLTLDPPVQSTKRQDTPSRAFMLSVKTVSFGAHLGESGQMTIKGFSVQFVPSFRPSVFSDFSGESHFTHNRMVYPEMTAHLRTERIEHHPRLQIRADVSGFLVDLDSSLPDYVFSLTDVYHHGKQQLDRINGSVLASSSSTSSTLERPPTPVNAPPAESGSALEVCASLLFRSGQIRLHSASDIPSPRGRAISFTNQDASALYGESDEDVIKLPELSVWMEYHASPLSQPTSDDIEASGAALLVKSIIHSSRNTLYPAKILPFLSEFNAHLVRRAKRRSVDVSTPEEQHSPAPLPAAPSSSNLRVSVCLQIDKSTLELTCNPDVNVIAGLHWESGGLVLNMMPGMRQMALSGAVDGLAVALRHGFLTDACATIETRGMSFSASYARDESSEGPSATTSLVVDTELVGGVRFSRLQDLLCFKAVWLDRIPVFSDPNPAHPAPTATAHVSATNQSPTGRFLTALCIRLRRLDVDVDLGQSISTVALNMEHVLIQTRLTDLISEFSLRVKQVNMKATGNVAGRADVPDFMFQTTRMAESALSDEPGQHQMLKLDITSGALNLAIESEHQQLLEYRADSVHVSISDDWSDASSSMLPADRELRLNFLVSGTTIAAAITVSSIPRLVTYADKFTANLQLQREGASRESNAFRIAQAPKPDNALSAVAEAMLQSARDRFQEAEAAFAYVIQQGVDLRLDVLQVAVFPRRMDDGEMAQFIGRQVQAYLERTVEPGSDVAKRDLRLAFSNMSVSRVSQLNHALARRAPPADTRDRLAKLATGAHEANIFGLPAMRIRMASEEHARTLAYDFESSFEASRAHRPAEDIYISLNVSLYAWLTFLRKNFAREMDDARGARPPPAAAAAAPRTAPDLPLISLSPVAGADSPTAGTPMSAPRSPWLPPDSPAQGGLAVVRPGPASRTPSGSSLRSPPLSAAPSGESAGDGAGGLKLVPRRRAIERLTMRQLGEATPDVMHPFFMKKAGFSLEDALPQYVHEYATQPLEEIMQALLELYSKQLRAGAKV